MNKIEASCRIRYSSNEKEEEVIENKQDISRRY